MVRHLRRRAAPENRARRSPPRPVAPGRRPNCRPRSRPHLQTSPRTKLLRQLDRFEQDRQARHHSRHRSSLRRRQLTPRTISAEKERAYSTGALFLFLPPNFKSVVILSRLKGGEGSQPLSNRKLIRRSNHVGTQHDAPISASSQLQVSAAFHF